MSASVTLLNDTPFVRDADINMLYLQVATVSNIVIVILTFKHSPSPLSLSLLCRV